MHVRTYIRTRGPCEIVLKTAAASGNANNITRTEKKNKKIPPFPLISPLPPVRPAALQISDSPAPVVPASALVNHLTAERTLNPFLAFGYFSRVIRVCGGPRVNRRPSVVVIVTTDVYVPPVQGGVHGGKTTVFSVT